MTNLEKMNRLVGSNEPKEKIIDWAYCNRISVMSLHLEEGFECMEKSINDYLDSDECTWGENEFKDWKNFLEREYIQ